MMKQRKVPMRMCVGCREMKPKAALIRVVRTPDGSILVDRRGKVSGRGAYICPGGDCFSKARKSHALERQLEMCIRDRGIVACPALSVNVRLSKDFCAAIYRSERIYQFST